MNSLLKTIAVEGSRLGHEPGFTVEAGGWVERTEMKVLHFQKSPKSRSTCLDDKIQSVADPS